MLATTAISTPRPGPNSRPAASVNAVRGNGNTVTTMCAPRKANGNQAPSDVAQSRSCTAVGSGTSSTTATRITVAIAVTTMRVRDTWRAVETTAELTLRSVLRVFDVTFTKITGPAYSGRSEFRSARPRRAEAII